MSKAFIKQLEKLNACNEGKAFANKHKTKQQAWGACKRGDWLLWVIGKKDTSKPWSEERKKITACCLEVALTVKDLWPKEQAELIGKAMEIMQGWTKGERTVEEAKQAKEDLRKCCTAYAAADYYYYVDAAAYAASASAAAYADAAAYVDAAAYAAYAAYTAAKAKNQEETANIVRKHYPKPPDRVRRALGAGSCRPRKIDRRTFRGSRSGSQSSVVAERVE